jgi:holo-ACP synthase
MTNLQRILAVREERVSRQQELIREYGVPCVTLTLNIPGPDKNRPEYEVVCSAGLKQLQAVLSEAFTILFKESNSGFSGPEVMFAVRGDSFEIKKCCAAIEETHPLGRLFDIDVKGIDMRTIPRTEIGMQVRKCLLCPEAAFDCIVSRKHNLEDVLEAIAEMISAYTGSYETVSE